MQWLLQLLNHLLEHERIKFRNIWLLHQKNVYIAKLLDNVKQYINTIYILIKIKPINVKLYPNFDLPLPCDIKILKYKVGDQMKTSAYKNVFSKV